jgi:ABC-type branched-subunit amino acid transport system substrate-binding protein
MKLIRAVVAYAAWIQVVREIDGTTVSTRGYDLLSPDFYNSCNFTSSIIISLPTDLYQEDTQFAIADMQLKAVWLVADSININRCGVHLPTGNASILLRAYADNSSVGIVTNITKALLNQNETNFYLGPYSSSLVDAEAKLTNSHGKILISGGAADTAIFKNRNYTFGTFPPVNKYMTSAIEMLAQHGAKTIVSLWENTSFTRGVCGAVPALVQRYNMSLVFEQQIRASPTKDDLYPISELLKGKSPDVVITCVYEAACETWVRALRFYSWSPKAQIFTVCLGLSSFEAGVGRDAEYMIGVTTWDQSMNIPGDITNLTAASFSSAFRRFAGIVPTYHAASAAASLSILVQAIELAGPNWENEDVVAKLISENVFPTVYGNISFDENGQSNAPTLVVQYDGKMKLQTFYPSPFPNSALVYPMPSWLQRDCVSAASCEGTPNKIRLGTCTNEGTCECLNRAGVKMVSAGEGINATCVPIENLNYIPASLTPIGTFFVAFQGFLSTCCIAWTKYFQKRAIVQASQPVFLILIALGSFILVSSILPLGVQGEYRYLLDSLTHGQTQSPNPDLKRLDMACMAWPWLYFIGFSLTYSSLFAKLWRIRVLFKSGQSFKRKVVRPKDVAIIIIIMVGANLSMLLIWQLVSPLKWQRTVIQQIPLSSVGECKPDKSWGWFLLMPPLCLEVFLLIVALVVSYQIRNVPSSLAEKKWIAISIYAICEILLLSVPVLVIAHNNTSAFYFVRVTVIFLQSCTVTLLIFLPKIYILHFGEEARKKPEERFKRMSSAAERATIMRRKNSGFVLPNTASLAVCEQCLSRTVENQESETKV